MNHYFSAPVWESQKCPNAIKIAKPKQEAMATGVRAIRVKHATYRTSSFDGVFHLSDKVKLPLPYNGWHSVEVYCCWFGHRLMTRGITIRVEMDTADVLENYTGSVVINLSS